ncbi:MAG: hypothetical protein KC547_18520 [Anaerolineae bacterium]|nr:hypothetical protein [Anaerolineae bacterium]
MNNQIKGVTGEVVPEGQILTYTLHSPARATLVEWSNVVLESLENWPKDKPYLAVHDISQPGIGMLFCSAVNNDIFQLAVLPETKARIDVLLGAHPDWTVALAVVVSGSLSGHLSKVLFARAQTDAAYATKAFFHKDIALRWLTEHANSRQPALR